MTMAAEVIPGRNLDFTIVESAPGAKELIEAAVEAAGGWRCEQHPDKPWPHDDCAGPGML
jgi:hypothetical protein